MPPKGKLERRRDRRPDRVGQATAPPGPPVGRRGPPRPPRRPGSRSPTRTAPSGRSGRSKDPPLPAVKDAAWPKSPIDRFVLAKLEAKGLHPVAAGRQAGPDPPGHVRPDRPAADARGGRGVPQRRLARGVREGRRPAARLAPLRRALGPALARRRPLRRGPGPHLPGPRSIPSGYRYRDWVVKALNADMPYDRFVIEQIAGDLLDGPGRDDRLAGARASSPSGRSTTATPKSSTSWTTGSTP